MKYILFFLSLSFGLHAQSVTIEPAQISKLKTVTNTVDDVVLEEIGSSPTIVGLRANGTTSANTAILNNNKLFTIGASGNIGANFPTLVTTGISFDATENWTTAAQGNAINFFAKANDEPIVQQVMTLNHNGNLGLNTNTPDALFHIYQNQYSSNPNIKMQTQNAIDDNMYIELTNGGFLFDIETRLGDFNLYTPGETKITTGGFDLLDYPSKINFRLPYWGNLTMGSNQYATAKLFVKGDDSKTPIVTNDNTTQAVFDQNGSNYIAMHAPDGTETGIGFGRPAAGGFGGGIIYNGNNDLNFRTNTNNTRLQILSAGKVGIGISPIAKFHVAMGLSGVVIDNTNTMAVESSTANNLIMATANGSPNVINFAHPSSSASITNTVLSVFQFRMGNNLTQVIANNDNIGIGDFQGANLPLAKLHIDGDIALKSKIYLSGNTVHNNKTRQGASVISVLNTGSVETLTGLSNGVDGLMVYLYPISGSSLVIQNEAAGSSDINRILTHTGGTVTITNTGGAMLLYDNAVTRWRLVNVSN